MVSTGDDAPRNQPDPQRFSAVNQRVRLCSERLYVAATKTRHVDAGIDENAVVETTADPSADAASDETSTQRPAKKAAKAEGLSLNAWLVRAIAAGLDTSGSARTRTSRISGWMR